MVAAKVGTTRQHRPRRFRWGGRADLRRRLRRQAKAELIEQEHHVGTGLGVAGEEQFAAVHGRHAHVEHLHGRKFLEHGAGHQSAGDAARLLPQRDRQAVGQKRHERVRFDPVGPLMKNRPQSEVTFERAERFLHKTQLHVATLDQFRIVVGEIGAQQVTAFAIARLAQCPHSSP